MTSKVQNTPAADTPTAAFRRMIESAGFTVTDLPDDLTVDQVRSLTEDLVRQLDAFTPADPAALRTLRMMAETARVPIDLSDVKTAADVTEASRVIAQGMSVLAGKTS